MTPVERNTWLAADGAILDSVLAAFALFIILLCLCGKCYEKLTSPPLTVDDTLNIEFGEYEEHQGNSIDSLDTQFDLTEISLT